jgi:nucleoside phosphorylase
MIVCLPAGHIGINPASTVATQMHAAFKGIRFGLMVGIGGGVPSAEADIRLGAENNAKYLSLKSYISTFH